MTQHTIESIKSAARTRIISPFGRPTPGTSVSVGGATVWCLLEGDVCQWLVTSQGITQARDEEFVQRVILDKYRPVYEDTVRREPGYADEVYRRDLRTGVITRIK